MITIRYIDLLLTILTGCAVTATVMLFVGFRRVGHSLRRLDALTVQLGEIVPELARTAQGAGDAARRVTELSDTAGRIASDVENVTAETREVAIPLIRELRAQTDVLQGTLRQASALIAGTKAGLAALRRNAS